MSSSTAHSGVISEIEGGPIYTSRMLQDNVCSDRLWHNASISSSTGGRGGHRSGKLADALRQGSRQLLRRSGKLLQKGRRRGKGGQADHAAVMMSAKGSQTGGEPAHALSECCCMHSSETLAKYDLMAACVVL